LLQNKEQCIGSIPMLKRQAMELYAWVVRDDARIRLCFVCKKAIALLSRVIPHIFLLARSSALPSFPLGRWKQVMAG
jgi:hypothetical protein